MNHGFCCSEAVLLPPADQARVMAGIAATGATYVRMSVSWPTIEPTQGQWTWTALDLAVKAATAAGLKPILVLEHPKPQAGFWIWTSDAAWATPAEYGKFCAAVVQHYPQVTDYELWNEPNLAAFWNPIDPVAFAPYLKAGYDAAKKVNPAATFALGGLAAALDGNGFSWWPFGYFKTSADTVTYLTALYTAGCQGHFDAVGYHPYVGNPYTFVPLEPVATAPSIVGFTRLRTVMTANGDGAKDIWPTEWGFSTGAAVTQVTPAVQATWLVEQWKNMSAIPQTSHNCLFTYRDWALPAANASSESYYGVVDFGYNPKPSLAALMAAWK